MDWWREKPFRMIQNNLRDIDGGMDADIEVRQLLDFGANVVQLGCGGISAFTQTQQPFQKKSPYLQGDKFGELLEKCHQNGIRVIARFDVSKAHVSFLESNPEWFSRSLTGKPVLYNDTAATCLNGPYQQERTMEIIGDIARKYPVDGIFFNMFGYQVRDYDGNYVGICQCENCKKRFLEFSGMELPTKEDPQDPAYRKYLEFKQFTVKDMLHKIRRTIKDINPGIAISTYSPEGIDIIRDESNSAVDRPYPFWLYSASDNTSSVRTTYPDKVSSNVAINAVDIPYRFMGVSSHLTKLRLLENMANGSNLDWCIIGSFPDYPDRENFEAVRDVFRFHRKYEELFARLRSVARVLLLRSSSQFEYRGIFRALKEAHILFDVVRAEEEERIADILDGYDLVILPGVPAVHSERLKDALLHAKASVVATGCSLCEDAALLKSLFGMELGKRIDPVRGSYLLTEPKDVFRSFPLRDWVYLDREAYEIKAEGAQMLLPLVRSAMYGPPERCFGHKVTDTGMAAVHAGKNLYLPWFPGTLYYSHGYEDFKQILLDLIRHLRPKLQDVTIKAPSCVEFFCDRVGEKQLLLQFINLSGFNGTTVTKPLSIEDIRLDLPRHSRVEPLREDRMHFVDEGVLVTYVSLPEAYEAFLVTEE